MTEGESSSGLRPRKDETEEGRIWQRLKSLLFGRNHEPTLREQLEEKIAEHEEDVEEGDAPEDEGDLSAPERLMLRNLLHFSENRVDDVMVPRSDILGLREDASLTKPSPPLPSMAIAACRFTRTRSITSPA
jgi:Mg2+/Co2+ transporter CorC